MAEPLNVIALISGGKDSFFSILHCIQNGHQVIALGNLYPLVPPSNTGAHDDISHGAADAEAEHDLNSFMYQTVGHNVIPLYEEALGIPLYRQQIIGTAVQTGTSYSHSDVTHSENYISNAGQKTESSPHKEEDETESLVPLLKRIISEHPYANAICTGAILSTYQRTRIESVAVRLSLTPLAYLWKYPILPPSIQTSLLEDMQAVGLDARIVKVASGGLDESFLWSNVASEPVLRRVEKSMKRFGTEGDGAVLGEGGEFETLVIDGPSKLFKGRIEIQEANRSIIREGGGSAWLATKRAKVVMKPPGEITRTDVRVPKLLGQRFRGVLDVCNTDDLLPLQSSPIKQSTHIMPTSLKLTMPRPAENKMLHWTISAEEVDLGQTISDQARKVVETLRQRLDSSSLDAADIVSTIIILRSMQDFAAINKVYGALFTRPNPPARVTISCGEVMPQNCNIIIHVKIQKPSQTSPPRKALHVQSRSYWAPANIGPYSQAISIPISSSDERSQQTWAVSVAGQIPLIPHTMTLPPTGTKYDGLENNTDIENFKLQTVLALQHLWRIGEDMDVGWWTSAVAYLPRGSVETVAARAAIAGKAWAYLHRRKSDEEEDLESDEVRDLWEEKHFAGMESRGGLKVTKTLPDWSMVGSDDDETALVPPVFAVEVEELPRQSQIEWHAHLGVVNGPVKVSRRERDGFWTVYISAFAEALQIVVVVQQSESVSEVSKREREALECVGLSSTSEWRNYASYLDVTVDRITDFEDSSGSIPCRSIWGADGKRLAAILLFETRP